MSLRNELSELVYENIEDASLGGDDLYLEIENHIKEIVRLVDFLNDLSKEKLEREG